MGIEGFDYSEAVEKKISTKEELGDLKDSVEYKLLQEDPKKALLLWFADSGNLPLIYEIDNDAKKNFSSPSVVEDSNFKEIISSIKKTMSFRTSLYSVKEVLAEINLPPISVKYVAPDGVDFVMKFGFENAGGNISLTPFVKGDEVNGLGFDVETTSKYYITSGLTETGDRSFSFIEKT